MKKTKTKKEHTKRIRQKLFLGKNGISDTLLFAMRMFVILPILFFLNIYANSFVVTNVNTEAAEMELFIERFLYSPDGFIYYDSDINRYYPGTLDLSKFNDEKINNMLFFNDEFMSIKFDIVFEDNSVITAYYNKRHYLLYHDISGVGESIQRQERRYFVNVYDNNELKNAVLVMNVVFVDV